MEYVTLLTRIAPSAKINKKSGMRYSSLL